MPLKTIEKGYDKSCNTNFGISSNVQRYKVSGDGI